jgi:hypothetical protein
MAKVLTEQEAAALLFQVFTERVDPGVGKRLKRKVLEGGGDELTQFRALHHFCCEYGILDRAIAQAGLGRVSQMDPLVPSPERGRLVQAFNLMVESYWAEGGERETTLHRAEAASSSMSAVRPVKGGVAMEVWVHAGRELVVRDLFTSDPYCVLTYRDPAYDVVQRFQTAVQESTLSPYWKESFLIQGVSPQGHLRVEVWDKDRVGEDDFMGALELEMASVDLKKGAHGWYALTGVESGALRIQLARAVGGAPNH